MKRESQMMMTKTTSNNYSNKIVLMTTMCKGLVMKMMMVMTMMMMGRKILKNMHSLIAKSHIPSDLPFFLTYTNCFRMSNLRST